MENYDIRTTRIIQNNGLGFPIKTGCNFKIEYMRVLSNINNNNKNDLFQYLIFVLKQRNNILWKEGEN